MDSIKELEARPLYPFFREQLDLFYQAMARSSPNVGERHWDQMKDQYYYLTMKVWAAVRKYEERSLVFQDVLKFGDVYIQNILQHIKHNSHYPAPEEEVQKLMQIINSWNESI